VVRSRFAASWKSVPLTMVVRASINDVVGHPFEGHRIELQSFGVAPACAPVIWPNGSVDDRNGGGAMSIACE
jgi:hypothetical protein